MATSKNISLDTEKTEHDGTTSPSSIPFWNMNIPLSQHTATCPPYLTYALTNEKDRLILSTPDATYHRQTWPQVRGFIETNRLDLFQRVPSDLRRYREYCALLAAEHGSVMAFVMNERLRWTDLVPRDDVLLADPADYKILLNDWPYGVDLRIKHLVVWTKYVIPEESGSEKLTEQAQKAVEGFVQRVFKKKCGEENVIWFKNWSSLKSIHAVEHFHVLLFDPPEGFVDEVTGGDVALADKVAREERDE